MNSLKEKMAGFLAALTRWQGGGDASPVGAEDAIDREDRVRNKVISVLRESLRGQHDFSDKSLSVRVGDNLLFHSLSAGDFRDNLLAELYNQAGLVFKGVEVIAGPAPAGAGYMEVTDKVSIGITAAGCRASFARKAQLTVFHGRGTLIGGRCELDAGSPGFGNGTRWNIGAGRFPTLSDGSYRKNQIALDDDPASPGFARNRFASRAHAYIDFAEGRGFVFHVERGGTKLADKKTVIYRDNEKIVMDNPVIPEVLQDGDIIELNREVQLLFTEKEEEKRHEEVN